MKREREWGRGRASLWFKKQKKEFLDKSSKTIDIFLSFFEPKWNPRERGGGVNKDNNSDKQKREMKEGGWGKVIISEKKKPRSAGSKKVEMKQIHANPTCYLADAQAHYPSQMATITRSFDRTRHRWSCDLTRCCTCSECVCGGWKLENIHMKQRIPKSQLCWLTTPKGWKQQNKQSPG